METTVDVAIIGAGTAGLNAMGQVRRAGKSFVLINGGELGTTCARVGCMPSKAVIQVAEDFHRRQLFERMGMEGHEGLGLDVPETLEYVRDLRDIFVDRVLSGSTDELEDELIEGYAEFLEPNLLKVGDETVRAGKIVIATGSRPIVPEAWRRFGDKILTSDEIFEQDDLPKSMAVIGLGVIGLELGQSLRRMGVKITGIDRLQTIGGIQDPAAAECAIELFGKEFPLWLGAPAELGEDGDQIRVTAGERSLSVDKVLVSLGRTPNLHRLGLERLGIAFDDHGVPLHDPRTMQIGDLPIFIAGDVTGVRPILHEAGDEGRIAGYNASHDPVTAFRRKTPLAINFCDPNIAFVGAGWNELQERSIAVGEMRLGPVGRAVIMGKNKGLLRVYADQASGALLGATLVSPKAEHLGHLLAWAIQQDLTVVDLLRMPFYHPAIEEALQAALYNLYANVDAKAEGLLELQREDV